VEVDNEDLDEEEVDNEEGDNEEVAQTLGWGLSIFLKALFVTILQNRVTNLS
jgi:hypothetical protein